MQKLWSVPFTIYATAYVRADTREAAAEIATRFKDTGLELQEHDCGVPISNRQYDDPQLPDFSLSPAMTLAGPEIEMIEETEGVDE